MVTNAQAMNFFQKFNQGEFPHQRLGQAFINHFKLGDACRAKHEVEANTACLFHLCDIKAAKAIWEEWVDDKS